MATLPAGYPHECTDEQIRSTIASLSQDIVNGPNINTVLQLSPLISLGQNELQRRLVEKMQRETITLKEITSKGASSSNESSKISIRLTRVNMWLTFAMLILTGLMLVLVWKQTSIAKRQNELFEKTTLAHPQLDSKFVDGKKIAEHTFAYELRVENSGNTFAEGAYLHIWLPQGLDMNLLWGGGLSLPPQSDGSITHYEFHIFEKILVGRNTRLAGIAFKFQSPRPFYELKYLVASPGAKDVSGTFIVRDNDFKPLADKSRLPKQTSV